MREFYEVLGLTENATDAEIENAYATLKAKYQQDRFLEGEAGNIAAKNLTRLETAYEEIKNSRLFESNGNEKSSYSDISDLIKSGKLDDAQSKLDSFSERDAEWHYLQSVIFYKKNWINESKKQLEISLSIDPNNAKYKDAYEKLKAKINYAEAQFHSGNANYSTTNGSNRQMGGDECGSMADCCATWCCLNMLCNGCCR
ncbi:MAG: hypothetical protein SPL13_00605 [Clostridia bacterium]|nr:hypothetical protein [Clostridia bacterium]